MNSGLCRRKRKRSIKKGFQLGMRNEGDDEGTREEQSQPAQYRSRAIKRSQGEGKKRELAATQQPLTMKRSVLEKKVRRRLRRRERSSLGGG